jgi:adenosine deaminase
VLAVLKELAPSRIGHGVAAANSEEALAKLAESGTVLEICPSSNLRTRAVADIDELGAALRAFERAGVRYTINTDGPYLLNTHLRREYQMLIESNILSDAEAERSVAVARAASFIR